MERKKLSKKEEEIKYLENLIQIMKSETLKDTERCYLEINEYNLSKKKFKKLSVRKRMFFRDFNNKIDRFEEKVLETLEYHDIKLNQKQIQEGIQYLKEKYDIK